MESGFVANKPDVNLPENNCFTEKNSCNEDSQDKIGQKTDGQAL